MSERRILFLVAAVQFINVLDFMMVMPLGPDFALALGISNAQLGLVGGSYTLAAAVMGIAGANFLDRFDRRTALAAALGGLIVSTAAGGLAVGLHSMLAARVLAGAFGGPATSIALSIIADVVPPARRGRAMGAVMGAFAVASVLGVPAGLEAARLGGWRAPFFGVAALGLVVTGVAVGVMPRLRAHLSAATAPRAALRAFLRRPVVVMTLAAYALAMMANFALIPNLSAYWQFNAGYPRERLGLLYMVGGSVSFFTMRIAGRLVDRWGATAVATAATAFFVPTLIVSFVSPVAALPVMVLFVAFMTSSTFRMIPMQALATRVPAPHERARFMSVQSAVQHLAAASGAILGAQMLVELPDGSLAGMSGVADLAVALALPLPLVLWFVESRVRKNERQQTQTAARVAAAVPVARSVP